MSRLILNANESFTIGASSAPVAVFGDAAGGDTITVDTGASVTLDPSFNSGKDTVVLQGNAAAYTIKQSGSSVILTDATGATVIIPVGTTGALVKFADATENLVYNTTTGHIMLGAMTVSTTPAAVTGGTGTGTVTTATLTTGVDTLTANVFNATGATLNALDNLTGGAGGKNSLNVVDTTGALAGAFPNATLNNIQTLNVASAGAVGLAGTPGSSFQPATATLVFGDTGSSDSVKVTVQSGLFPPNATVTTSGTYPTLPEAVAAWLNSGNHLGAGFTAVANGDTVTVTGPNNTAVTSVPTISFSNPTNAAADIPVVTTTAAVQATAGTPGTPFDVSNEASVTTVNITNSTGNDNVVAASTQTVNLVDTAGSVTIDGGAAQNVATTAGAVTLSGAVGDVNVSDLYAGGNAISVIDGSNVTINATGTTAAGGITVGAYGDYATGAIKVTETGAGSISVDGGTSVAITSTAGTVGGDIVVGENAAPSGAVTISQSVAGKAYSLATEAPAVNAAGGAITVTGGTTVSVTESTSTPTNSPLVSAANASVTEGAVTVYGTVASADVPGSVNTTSVTVNQAAAATEHSSSTATPGVAPVAAVDSITFSGSLAAGASVTVGGLTFTNTSGAALTPAQVAAAFANLTTSTVDGTHNPVYQGTSTLGSYSGTLTGFSTSAVTTGGTVAAPTASLTLTGNVDPVLGVASSSAAVFSSTGGITAVDTPLVAGVNGQLALPATPGVVGVTDGEVTITDANYESATAAGTIATVTANNFNSLNVYDNALHTLNLGGTGYSTNPETGAPVAPQSEGEVLIKSGGLTGNIDPTLNLSLNGVNAGILIDGDTGEYTTININQTASSLIALSDSELSVLNVAGSGTLTLEEVSTTALAKVTVSGSAGLVGTSTLTGDSHVLDLSGATNLTDVNASATTGKVDLALGADTSFEGGSGTVVLHLASGTAEVVSLGSGNDTVYLAGGVPTGTIRGGGGVDTLVMSMADAAADSLLAGFTTAVTGFADLALGEGTGILNLVGLGFASSADTVALAGGSTVTLNGFASGETLALNGTSDDVILANTAWATTPATINIAAAYAGGGDFGTVTASHVATVNIAALDTTPATPSTPAPLPGTTEDTIAYADSTTGGATTAIHLTGNVDLTLDVTASKLATVDASGMSGGITYTDSGTVAETIHGGAAGNSITANIHGDIVYGGAGVDTLTATVAGVTLNAGSGSETLVGISGDTLNGGAGSDVFSISGASATPASGAVINGLHTGDVLVIAGATAFASTAVTLGANATLDDYANAAVSAAGAAGKVEWFQFGGSTYVVENNFGVESHFNNAGVGTPADTIVQINGLVNLAHASFSSTTHGLLIG